MPRTITQYRCLLISPGDLEPERDALQDVVTKWNAHLGRSLGINVELVRWEVHSTPDLTGSAQDVINKQMVDECDLGIALFWSRLGTRTKTHPSGSIEEIHRLKDAGLRVAVYFKTAPLPNDLDTAQLDALRQAKKDFRKLGLLGEFGDIASLREDINLYLTNALTSKLVEDRSKAEATPQSAVLTASKPDVRVRVQNAVTMNRRDEPFYFISISVANHSPVKVYISGIGVVTANGQYIVGGMDVITGRLFGKVDLEPGQSFDYRTSVSQLETSGLNSDSFEFVYARDQIGRSYQSPPGELANCITQIKKIEADPNR